MCSDNSMRSNLGVDPGFMNTHWNVICLLAYLFILLLCCHELNPRKQNIHFTMSKTCFVVVWGKWSGIMARNRFSVISLQKSTTKKNL